MNGCAPCFALIERLRSTQKWAIRLAFSTTDSFNLFHYHSQFPHFYQMFCSQMHLTISFFSVSFQVELENKRLYGHFAAVFGFMCGLLKLSLVQTLFFLFSTLLFSTLLFFLFSTLRTVIASAVRLGNIGPLQVTASSSQAGRS